MSNTTTIKVGESAKTITLQEGKALILTGSVGAVGVAYLLDAVLGGTNSLRSWAVGAGVLAAIGPYEDTQKIHLTCAAGSISARVLDAVLTIQAGGGATKPVTPAAPVLTAVTSAISVAYTTPADGGSTIVEAQFTDINGVSTTLTGSPQTIPKAAGAPITGSVRFRNGIGWSDYSPQSNSVTPIAPHKLRVVTVNNQVNTTTASAGPYDRYHTRTNVDIGSGNASKMIAAFMNWYLTGTYTDGPSTYFIESMTVENSAGTLSAPVTFNGQRASGVLAVGANDVQSDDILPSALGLSGFVRGYRAWIKIVFRLPAKGVAIVAASGRNTTASPAGVQNFWSASDVDIGLSSIDTPGPWTWTSNPGVAGAGAVPCPFMLGTFVSGDPATWLGVGDSIMEDTGDMAYSAYGSGLFQRALIGGGAAGDLLAGINVARAGITIAGIVSDPKVLYWQKYCKYTAEESGTNTFGTTGTVTSAAVQAQITPLWTTCRSNGAQGILRTKLLVRTFGAYTLADQSDQTYFAGWGPAGPVDQFNTWLDTQTGAAINAVVAMGFVRTGPDPFKWPADGTVGKYSGDGTHASAYAYAGMAAELRTGMNAFS